LAKRYCAQAQLAHLDLDTLAWRDCHPPERRSVSDSRYDIEAFIERHCAWVIEGCYSDLLELLLPHASELIFLNLPVERCIANAKQRLWEPHKYSTKQAQDDNLPMLIDWISQYTQRSDEFSLASHLALYNAFEGEKSMLVENE